MKNYQIKHDQSNGSEISLPKNTSAKFQNKQQQNLVLYTSSDDLRDVR